MALHSNVFPVPGKVAFMRTILPQLQGNSFRNIIIRLNCLLVLLAVLALVAQFLMWVFRMAVALYLYKEHILPQNQ